MAELLSTCASARAGYRTVGLEDTEDLVSGDDCEIVSTRAFVESEWQDLPLVWAIP
jgi:hypothetical protein